tara:strand:+ start:1311 stop:1580 length:270 start_codon:yes stop_codon:yes gene_type:complete
MISMIFKWNAKPINPQEIIYSTYNGGEKLTKAKWWDREINRRDGWITTPTSSSYNKKTNTWSFMWDDGDGEARGFIEGDDFTLKNSLKL